MADLFSDEEQQETDEIESQGDIRFDAVLTSSDWTVQTIVNQIKKGNIDLDPNFQRRDAWRIKRKSELIESILLNIPIPQIVLAEKKGKKGSYVVIDGKQRLLTLRQFVGYDYENPQHNKFRLRGISVRTDLIGSGYDELKDVHSDTDDFDSFENYTIRSVVIRNWPNEDFLYLVFHRLNTGSVPLSPQELRQALHPGPFSKFVNEHSIESEQIRQVLGIDKPDFRMRDTELLIRYLAFRNFLPDYKGNLKPLLDHATEKFNRNWDTCSDQIFQQAKDFDYALEVLSETFGTKYVFRKWNGLEFERAFNRAIFDALILLACDKMIRRDIEGNKKLFFDLFKDLCANDGEFRDSIEGTTKSKSAISTRVRKIAGLCIRIGSSTSVINRILEGYELDQI